MGSPAQSETDRESLPNGEGEGGEERGNESPETEEERGGEGEEEEEEEEEEVARSEAGTDTLEAAGTDHCVSEQGSPYSQDRPPCITERYGPTFTHFYLEAKRRQTYRPNPMTRTRPFSLARLAFADQ